MSDVAAILSRQPLVEAMSAEHREELSRHASLVHLGVGELLVREGDPADATWLLDAGRVDLEIHVPGGAARQLHTVHHGQVLGWSWLYPPQTWHFDARVAKRVRAIRLDGDGLRARCEAEPAFGFDLLRALLKQVHQRLEHTRLQALDVYGADR